MSREKLDLAVRQIEFARGYTNQLWADIDDQDWFRQVPGCPTHLAWQVGHLAMAEYALTMLRLRGKEREDEQFLTKSFFRCFQKGTTPQFDASAYPSPDEIRQTLDAVHQHALKELAGWTDAQLEEKLPEPHAVFDTKLGSVIFCSAHELIHGGQIGLLRRMLGADPIR